MYNDTHTHMPNTLLHLDHTHAKHTACITYYVDTEVCNTLSTHILYTHHTCTAHTTRHLYEHYTYVSHNTYYIHMSHTPTQTLLVCTFTGFGFELYSRICSYAFFNPVLKLVFENYPFLYSRRQQSLWTTQYSWILICGLEKPAHKREVRYIHFSLHLLIVHKGTCCG